MELKDFLCQTQSQVINEVSERMSSPDKTFPYDELVFAEIVMQHMAEHGMTYEPQVCHYSSKDGNASLRLSGYSISEDGEQLDLFVSLYDGVTDIVIVPDKDTKSAAEQCLRFLVRCAQGKLASKMDESNEAYELARVIQETYTDLEQIRIYVLTDRQAKTKKFKDQESNGKTIKLEVMDIERLHRHWSEGKPRDELVVNFQDISGGALPCIYVPNDDYKYDYALTAMPGEALRFMYEKYGSRLLEANVRSFLSITGKVNQGIRKTLQEQPEQFMAYNNGVVIVADEIHLGTTKEGGAGILWLKGMQIVNGGQTTASIYFSKKKDPNINLAKVRVPAKIIILKSQDIALEESLISDISKYANSQNVVKLSDLSANKPFHVEMERLSMTTYCPDGVGRWFYERASGSYNTFLAREGTTTSRLKHLKEVVTPSSRKIIKTDLAKYINAWDKKPHIVSLGSQKNFEQFMNEIKKKDIDTPYKPTLSEYKDMIAKAIIFKRTQSLARSIFTAYQANVTAYVVSILSDRIGNKIDLEKIWFKQDISEKLKEQITIWAREVNSILESTSNGRMISEWAKKVECWNVVSNHVYSPIMNGIPEVQY